MTIKEIDRGEAQKIAADQYRTDLQNAWTNVQYDIGALAQRTLYTSTTDVYTTVASDTVIRLQSLNFTVSLGTPFTDPSTQRSVVPVIVSWS